MSCWRCDAPTNERAAFCTACGANLEHRCTRCGRASPLAASFCAGCGASLEAIALGERRIATVMFTDLSGYVALTELLDPEEVAEVVNDIKDAVGAIVLAHGGLANQFVGDAVMALFGLPTAEDDDPRRAVAAALAVHERVRAIGERVRPRLAAPLAMHTGIETGLVVAQLRDQRDGIYAVTGDAANMASRLLGLAGPDQILLGPETQDRVAPYFESELVGQLDVKGKAEALRTHRVLRARPLRSRFDAARDRGLTPWIGRERELARLQQAYEEMWAGRGSLVTIVGDAGVGKSRLCHEFLSRIDPEAVAIYVGRCQSYGTVTPYLPFVQAFLSGAGLREGDPPSEVIARTIETVRRIDPALTHHLPVLLHVLSVRSDEYPMPAEWRGEELPEAIERAIVAVDVALSRRRPMILRLEDWHWADEASQSALRHFARSIAGERILLLVDYRLQVARSLPEQAAVQIELEPFSLEDTRALVCRCLGCESVQHELALRIQERTLGNPLFVEEICASLQQSSRIERQGGAVRLRGSIDELDLPETVQTVIRSRIDKLAPQTRELLRLASVIGREFSLDLLHRLAPRGCRTGELIDELEQLEFVQPIPGEIPGRFHFKHVTTQEVTYATLLQKQRSAIHHRVAGLIESLYADGRLEEHLEALAGHYLAAGDDERAIHFLERAGAKAASSFALQQARQHYGRAVARATAIGDDETAVRRRVRLTLRWAETCIYHPSLSQLANLERALRDAESLGDRGLAQRVRYWICWILHSVGDQTRALAEIGRALEIAGPAAPEPVVGPLRRLQGQCLLISRDSERALELLARVVEERRESARHDEQSLGGTYAYSMGQIGLLLGQRGDFDGGLRHFGEAVDLVRKRGLRSSESAILITQGLLHTMRGDWEGAVRVARESRVIAEHMRAPYHLGTDDVIEGYALFQQGDAQNGLETLQRGLENLEECGAFLTRAWSLACLADVMERMGRCDDALRIGEQALARAAVGDRLGEDIAARALVRAAARGPAERLPVELGRLLEITRARGNPREQALAALCVAEVHAPCGRPEAARQALADARAQLDGLDMPYYRERARSLADSLRSSTAS